MPNPEHVAMLNRGPDAWNQWKRDQRGLIDLRNADLRGRDLSNFDLGVDQVMSSDDGSYVLRRTLTVVSVSGADLSRSRLANTRLSETNLSDAKLAGAALVGAFLISTNLARADLRDVSLAFAKLESSNLIGTNLTGAILRGTVFVNTYLRDAIGLAECVHKGPSSIDIWTLMNHPALPREFLQGCGVPDRLIDSAPYLFGEASRFYSCFISYSCNDQDFVCRLRADLQTRGVTCWVASEDLKIGAKFRSQIESSIQLHNKVLLVLSESSIASSWVEDEVESTLERERRERMPVLLPIRIDDKIAQTDVAWAAHLRQKRHIGNFSGWKDEEAYQTAFKRLLRDLSVDAQTGEGSHGRKS